MLTVLARVALPERFVCSHELCVRRTHHSTTGYYQLGYFGFNDAPTINLLFRILSRAAPQLHYTSPHLLPIPPPKQPGEKIRVGFMSVCTGGSSLAFPISPDINPC